MSNVDDKSDQVTNVLEASGAPKLTSAPWSPEDGKLLGTMPDSEVARLLNRAPSAIRHRRQKLRIPAYQSAFHLWTPEEEQLAEVAPIPATARASALDDRRRQVVGHHERS